MRYMATLLKGPALALGLLVVGGAAHAEDLCFQRGDACLSASELAESGVASVRFQPLGLRRDDGLTAWSMYAYRPNGTVLAQTIEARWHAFIQGENQVLALQEDICAALVAGGVACNSDFLDGAYGRTNGGAFDLTLTNESRTDLTAQGRFTTKRWSCSKDAEGERVDVAVTCSGTYTTSRRLLYLTNTTYLTLADVECSESETRLAATAVLRACPEDGSFPAADWLPTGGTRLNIRALGPSRLISPEHQLSLLRR